MASFGLRVNKGPTLNLSGIFKAAMPDPDLAIKAALANSTISGQEHQNQLYDQQREYARQQAAQEAQKTRDLEVLAGVRKAAVPGIEQAYIGAIPRPADRPVPVELSRIAGPVNGVPVSAPPAIVDQKFYDDAVAGAKAQASLYPYIAKDATDAATAYGKTIGQETLAAGLTPGGPAAVNLTPDKLRLAATLTGQMPTMSTALTKDDTVGADMATRQAVQTAAGKLPYDITLEREKAVAKAQADLAANPLGASGSGPAAYLLAMLTAKEKTPAGLTPEEQQVKIQTQAIVDKANAVTPGEKGPIFVPDGKGGMTRVAGPDPNGPTPPYSGGSVAADDSNILLEVALDMAAGRPIDPAKAQQYQLAFDRSWPEKAQIIRNADGTSQTIDPTPAPAGWPTKEAVRAAASLSAQGGPAPAGGIAAPVPAEIARLGVPPAGMVAAPTLAEQTTGQLSPLSKVVPPPTLEQGRDQSFASLMQQPALDMNEIGVNDLPSLAEAAQIIKSTAATASSSPSLFGAALDLATRDMVLSPAARAYEQAVAAWTSDSLYKLSGAAISPPEWVRQQLAMVPMYGDGPEQLLKKARERSIFLRTTAKQGWSNDAASYKSFVDQTRLQGLELDYPIGALPPINGPAAGEPSRRPKIPASGAPAAPAAAASPEEEADRKQPPPRTRTKGLENTDDKVWEKIYRKLPWSIRQKLRAAG